MVFLDTAETPMKKEEHESRPLKLVAGDAGETCIAARRYCTNLATSYMRLCNGAEKSLRPGMLAQWKRGMKNRTSPEYGAPMVVVEVLEPPIIDCKFDSGSVYYREPLDILLGFLDEDKEFYVLHYDSRRFEPYTEAT